MLSVADLHFVFGTHQPSPRLQHVSASRIIPTQGQMDTTTRAGPNSGGTSLPLPQSSNNSGSEAGEVGEDEGGGGGRGDASVGSGAGVQLTKLVLKFTTASEADVQPSREVGRFPVACLCYAVLCCYVFLRKKVGREGMDEGRKAKQSEARRELETFVHTPIS